MESATSTSSRNIPSEPELASLAQRQGGSFDGGLSPQRPRPRGSCSLGRSSTSRQSAASTDSRTFSEPELASLAHTVAAEGATKPRPRPGFRLMRNLSSTPSPGACRPWPARAWPWMAREPEVAGSDAPQEHRHPSMRTVANLVDALNDHESTSAQCEEDLTSLCNIASGDEVDVEGRVGSKQRMASLGAIEGIIGVLWAHLSCAPVQEKGFLALHHLANGETCADDDAEARKLHMVDAAALETITSGMRLHVRSAAVELLGLDVLSSIATVSGGEEARAYCMRRLEAAGAIEATVAALQAHSACVKLHERGFGVLCDMSSGEENVIADRLQRMVEAGVIEAVVRGLHAHEACATVQEDGFVMLCNLSGGNGYDADRRARLMASAGAIEAIVAGLQAHVSSAEVQERGVCALSNIASGGDEVIARRMAEASVVETVEKALEAHMSHAELWACGQATLLSILGAASSPPDSDTRLRL